MRRFLLCLVSFILLIMTSGCNAKWPGYVGYDESYVYYYSDGKAREWEEDVIVFANDYLNSHPYFVDGPIKVVCNQDYWNENLYREDLRQEFIESIHALIPKIEKMEDYEIIWELQKALGKLKDGHAWIFMMDGDIFPIELEVFYQEDKPNLHIVKTISNYEDALYAKVISINGVSVEEMIDRIEPIVSHENKYALYDIIDNAGMNYTFRQKDILVMLGVMEKSSNHAAFLLEVQGEVKEMELCTLSNEEYLSLSKVGRDYQETYSVPFQYRGEKQYWYQMDADQNTMYIRIDSFTEDEAQSLFVMAENVRKEIQKSADVKVIVDLRGNPGGYKFDGYDHLVEILKVDEITSVYVLTDDSSASQSLLMTSKIKLNVAGSKVVGVPIGQATTMFGCWHKVLPNTNTHYNVSESMYRVYTDKTEDVLVPDVLIYPTLQDYMQGKDTILEAVKAME